MCNADFFSGVILLYHIADKNFVVIMAWRDIKHPQAGGAEVYIKKVAEYIRDKGFNVYYLTAKYPNAKRNEIIDGINYVRRGNTVSIYFLLPLYFLQMKKHLYKFLNQ